MDNNLTYEILHYMSDPVNRGIPVTTDNLVSAVQEKGSDVTFEVIDNILQALFKVGYVYQSAGFWYPTTPGVEAVRKANKTFRTNKVVTEYQNLQNSYKEITPKVRDKKGWKDWEKVVKDYLPSFTENHPEYSVFIKYLTASPANWTEFIKDVQAIYLKWDITNDKSLKYPDEKEYNRPSVLVSIEHAMDESIRRYYQYVKSDRHRINFNTEYRGALDLISSQLPEIVKKANDYLKSIPLGTMISNKDLLDKVKSTDLKNVDAKIADGILVKSITNAIDYSQGRFVEGTAHFILVNGVKELMKFNGKPGDIFNTFRSSAEHIIGADFRMIGEEIIGGERFDGVNLQKIELSGLSILNSSFVGTDLSNSIWVNTYVHNNDFSSAKLIKAKFTPSECTDNIFINTDFNGAFVGRDIEWDLNKGYPINLSMRDVNYAKEELKDIIINSDSHISYALPIVQEDLADALTLIKAFKPIVDKFQNISSKNLSFKKFAVQDLSADDINELRKFLLGKIDIPQITSKDKLFNYFVDLNREGKLKEAGFTVKEINTLMGKARSIIDQENKNLPKKDRQEEIEQQIQIKIQGFQNKYKDAKVIPIQDILDLFNIKTSQLYGMLQTYQNKEGLVLVKSIFHIYHALVYTLKDLHVNSYVKPNRFYQSFPYTSGTSDLTGHEHSLAGSGTQFGIHLYPNYSAMSKRMVSIVNSILERGSSHIKGALAFSRITPLLYTVLPLGKKRPQKFKVWYISEMQADDYQKIGSEESARGERKELRQDTDKKFGKGASKEFRNYYRHWPENLLNVIITQAGDRGVDQIWMPSGEEVAKKTGVKTNWYNFYDRPAKVFGGETQNVGAELALDPGSNFKHKSTQFYVIDLSGGKSQSNLNFDLVNKNNQLKTLSFYKTGEYNWDEVKENLEHHFDYFLSRHKDLHNEAVNRVVSDDMVIQWGYRSFFDEYNIPRFSREDPEFMNEVKRIIIEDLGYKLFGHPYVDWMYWVQKAYNDLLWFIPKQRTLLGINISDKELARDWWLLWSQDQIPPDIKIAPWIEMFKGTIRDLVLDMGLGDVYDTTVYHLPESEQERVPESEHQEGTENMEYVDPMGKTIEGPTKEEDELYNIQAKEDLDELKNELLNQYLDELSQAQLVGDTQKIELLKKRLNELQSASSIGQIKELQKLSWKVKKVKYENKWELKEALENDEISEEEAEEKYPGWYDRIKSIWLDESLDENIDAESSLKFSVYNSNRSKYGQDNQNQEEIYPQAEEGDTQKESPQTQESPQKTQLDIYYLDVEDIINTHDDIIVSYGGRPELFLGGKEKLDAAIGRMVSAFGEEEFFPSVFEKAAVLMHSIITTHPFIDGNKRTAYMSAVTFLQYNDFDLDDSEELADIIIKVAESQAGYEHLLEWVGRNAKHLIEKHSPSLKKLTWQIQNEEFTWAEFINAAGPEQVWRVPSQSKRYPYVYLYTGKFNVIKLHKRSLEFKGGNWTQDLENVKQISPGIRGVSPSFGPFTLIEGELWARSSLKVSDTTASLKLGWQIVNQFSDKTIIDSLNRQEYENREQPGYIDQYYSAVHSLTYDQAINLAEDCGIGELTEYTQYYLALRHMLGDIYYDFIGTDDGETVDMLEADAWKGSFIRILREGENNRNLLSWQVTEVLEPPFIESLSEIPGFERYSSLKLSWALDTLKDYDYKETDSLDGTIRYYNKKGKLHRIDGPAIECADGIKYWYINGNLHRIDGPAIESVNGNKYWYVNGKLHRIDGPAIEYVSGSKRWYINGNFIGNLDDGFTDVDFERYKREHGITANLKLSWQFRMVK